MHRLQPVLDAVRFAALLLAPASVAHASPAPESVWLDAMDLSRMSSGWGSPQAGKSITEGPITLSGTVYAHGVGTHAPSELLIDLKREATRFIATVGLDDARIGKGSIRFHVYADHALRAETPVMHGGDPPKRIDVDVKGARYLQLVVDDADDGIDNDHADWADARIVLRPGAKARPEAIGLPPEPTPVIASGVSPVPAIHGPRIVGATPGRPFLFRIPATGAAPLTFAAAHLPEGLSLDAATGIITGSLKREGSTVVELSVRGPRGVGRRKLTIVGGKDKLALTPPMGWNSWYVWFGSVSQKRVEEAADWMVKSGLAAHGYNIVAIDDCWEGKRSPDGEIAGNERFPDMKALGDHIHALGLKFGIYSSPGPRTCGGYEGSWQHEEQDAATYARWGVDLLKYDWCSYGQVAGGDSLVHLQRPYAKMKAALEKTNRDIIYSLCQYGMGRVWEWGREVGGHFWRTTGDSGDSWGVVSAIGFGQAGLEDYAGPGGWNDPDMIQAGSLGGDTLHKSKLTPNEQLTQMSLWSLVAAPLLLSCDLSQLDPWTTALLTNDEVIDVDQDPLGKAGGRRAKEGNAEVWSRPLADGTLAVGLFNRGVVRQTVTAKWSDLEIDGPQQVRDLWKRKDIGVRDGEFSAVVPPHGCVLVKIGTPTAR